MWEQCNEKTHEAWLARYFALLDDPACCMACLCHKIVSRVSFRAKYCVRAVYVEYKNEEAAREDSSYEAVCDVSERMSCSKVRV